MWFDKSLRNQISKLNLHRKWKKNKSDCRQLSKFKAARAKVEQLIKKKRKKNFILKSLINASETQDKFMDSVKSI